MRKCKSSAIKAEAKEDDLFEDEEEEEKVSNRRRIPKIRKDWRVMRAEDRFDTKKIPSTKPKKTSVIKKEKCACDICKKVFCDVGSMNRHMRSFHLNIKPFTCNRCGKATATHSDMKSHLLWMHYNKREIQSLNVSRYSTHHV